MNRHSQAMVRTGLDLGGIEHFYTENMTEKVPEGTVRITKRAELYGGGLSPLCCLLQVQFLLKGS